MGLLGAHVGRFPLGQTFPVPVMSLEHFGREQFGQDLAGRQTSETQAQE